MKLKWKEKEGIGWLEMLSRTKNLLLEEGTVSDSITKIFTKNYNALLFCWQLGGDPARSNSIQAFKGHRSQVRGSWCSSH